MQHSPHCKSLQTFQLSSTDIQLAASPLEDFSATKLERRRHCCAGALRKNQRHCSRQPLRPVHFAKHLSRNKSWHILRLNIISIVETLLNYCMIDVFWGLRDLHNVARFKRSGRIRVETCILSANMPGNTELVFVRNCLNFPLTGRRYLCLQTPPSFAGRGNPATLNFPEK